ncbi:MAG: hypothetical protein JNM50_12820 [Chromatiales bacterium]|nr:hypothetical protein [Chromatiales bacterium]
MAETPLEVLRRAVPKIASHPMMPREVRDCLAAALGAMEIHQRELHELAQRVEAAASAVPDPVELRRCIEVELSGLIVNVVAETMRAELEAAGFRRAVD